MVCLPFWWCCVQEACASTAFDPLRLLSTPCFCSMLFRSGIWAVWSFCILSIICPNCSCRQLFLVSYSLFVFSCLRKFVQVQALQQRVPGSSLSHLQQQLGGPALPRLNSSVSLAQENGSKFCVPPSHSAYLLKEKISQPWHC